MEAERILRNLKASDLPKTILVVSKRCKESPSVFGIWPKGRKSQGFQHQPLGDAIFDSQTLSFLLTETNKAGKR